MLDILQVSGFSEGALPFKYLGVPISAGRLSVKNCSCLIEKITEKIHGYAAKKLSYAGRLTLVNSVLTTLYTYWASIFILPKGVLRRIDALCRNYLWDGSTEYVRSPLVSWEKVCVPKDEGGLGIRHNIAWNLASICKLSWWIYSNQDSLWTICKVKDKFSAGFSSTGLWLPCPSGYSVSSGYQWIRQKQPTVTWNKVIWNSWCISKHSFISWLIAREALQLKDKLFLLGIISDDVCFLCGSAAENHKHLFTQCCYTRQLFRMLSLKLNICLPVANLLVWMQTKPWAKIKKQVTIVWTQALYYTIWHQRNKARLEGVVQRPEHVFQQLKCLLKCRFLGWHVCIKRSSDRTWFKTVTY
ncbi:uncharacterized protein LOC141588565 [Silene latifolia]|uniref:uncharacterized protein LOC141588565 n=1 Tax=Silene latifolia TaxID=37657 RepID=UPI003D789369